MFPVTCMKVIDGNKIDSVVGAYGWDIVVVVSVNRPNLPTSADNSIKNWGSYHQVGQRWTDCISAVNDMEVRRMPSGPLPSCFCLMFALFCSMRIFHSLQRHLAQHFI